MASRPPRLINARTHKLESTDDRALPYAILSHTWRREEVGFQDWQSRSFERTWESNDLDESLWIDGEPDEYKEGYTKVVGACKQAIIDGLEYVWADTCCIDKTNHVELSEAINSMYAWYGNAEVCYAFLADVSRQGTFFEKLSVEETTPEQASRRREEFIDQLRCSQWFTRGWTLQELLSPRKVLFFDNDWTALDDLQVLLRTVSEITSIPEEVLRHEKAVSDCTIAQRISWASSRKTKRVEDRAYSLLGLLDVQMVANYGEGRSAFRRLQERILMMSRDLSILAWSSAHASQARGLLAESPLDFESCIDIEKDATRQSSPSYWLTNVGLKGSLPILDEEEQNAKGTLVLLNCCRKGTPQDVLALRLTRLTAPHDDTTYAVQASKGRQPEDILPSRLASVSSFRVAEARMTQLTVMFDGPSLSATELALCQAEVFPENLTRNVSPVDFDSWAATHGLEIMPPAQDLLSRPSDGAIGRQQFPETTLPLPIDRSIVEAEASKMSEASAMNAIAASSANWTHPTFPGGSARNGNSESREVDQYQPTKENTASSRDEPENLAIQIVLNGSECMNIPSSPLQGQSAKVRFWFQVDQMGQSESARNRTDEVGNWLPPRSHGSNVLLPGYNTGRYYEYDDGRTRQVDIWQIGVPIRYYKIASFYFIDGRVRIWPEDATQYTIGENDDTTVSNADYDRNDDSKFMEDWQPLRFRFLKQSDSLPTNYVTYKAKRSQLQCQQQISKGITELLPDRYMASPENHNVPEGYGGLSGNIAVLIALVAYSVSPALVEQALIQCIGRSYRPHGLSRGKGCKFASHRGPF